MKNKDLGLIVLGVAAFMMLRRRQQPAYSQFQNVPPPPPRNNSAAYQQWIQTIIGTYGTIAELWQPGGPFYNNVSQQEAQQAVNSTDPYDYNPYDDDYQPVEVLV